LSVGLSVESRPHDVDDAGNAASDRTGVVNGKGLVERLVRREDLAGVCRDACRLVSDMNRSFEIPVQEVDGGASGYMGEAHVIEYDTIVLSGELAKVIHMGDDEWVVEAVDSPLGLASVGGTPDVEGLEIGPKGETPICIGPLVGELGWASDVVSDEFNVPNRADFHSSDVNGLPQG